MQRIKMLSKRGGLAISFVAVGLLVGSGIAVAETRHAYTADFGFQVVDPYQPDIVTSVNGSFASLEKEGFPPSSSMRRGLSGVEHNLDLVMENEKGVRLGYIVSDQGTVGDVIRGFILQTDCEFQVQVLRLAQPDAQARELADSYNITLIPYRGA